MIKRKYEFKTGCDWCAHTEIVELEFSDDLNEDEISEKVTEAYLQWVVVESDHQWREVGLLGSPLQVGDRVYHYKHGWGIVRGYYEESIYVELEVFSNVTDTSYQEGYYATPCELSYTKYDLINGGLTHTKP